MRWYNIRSKSRTWEAIKIVSLNVRSRLTNCNEITTVQKTRKTDSELTEKPMQLCNRWFGKENIYKANTLVRGLAKLILPFAVCAWYDMESPNNWRILWKHLSSQKYTKGSLLSTDDGARLGTMFKPKSWAGESLSI